MPPIFVISRQDNDMNNIICADTLKEAHDFIETLKKTSSSLSQEKQTIIITEYEYDETSDRYFTNKNSYKEVITIN